MSCKDYLHKTAAQPDIRPHSGHISDGAADFMISYSEYVDKEDPRKAVVGNYRYKVVYGGDQRA